LAHCIPADAARQLDVMAQRGVHAIAFTSAGGWVVVGRPGAGDVGYSARGIPDACFVTLGEFVREGHAVRCIAFTPDGGWVIVTDQAYFASGIPDACFRALVDTWAAGLRPSCIAFAPGGGWALLAGGRVAGAGLPREPWQQLQNWAHRQRPAMQAAFAPGGGWALLSADDVAHAGLPEACVAHLNQVAQAHQVERLAFTASGGWAVGSHTFRTPAPDDPLRVFEERFRLVNGRWRTLAERLAAEGCMGAAFALAASDGRCVATAQGAVDDASWRGQAAAWLAGIGPEPALQGGHSMLIETAAWRASALAVGPGAEALMAEMAEAAGRAWPSGPGPVIP